MTILTVYTLFGDDVRVLAFDKTADVTFWILTSVSFGAFALEIILASISKDEYFLGFYFWLDLISTISLITDIGWIMNAMMGTSGTGGASNAK
jgi:hypothetical protein